MLDLEAALARVRETMGDPKGKPVTPESAQDRLLEEAVIVSRALDNPAGKALQELLWRKFGAPVVFDPALGFENGAAAGFYRSGQATMLNWLGSMIGRARTGKPPAKKEKADGRKRH